MEKILSFWFRLFFFEVFFFPTDDWMISTTSGPKKVKVMKVVLDDEQMSVLDGHFPGP